MAYEHNADIKEFEQLSADERFYLIMKTSIERVKSEYIASRDYLMNRKYDFHVRNNCLTKELKAEQRAALVKLEDDAVTRMGMLLQKAAHIFGYNSSFRVHSDGDSLWYEPRNKSAERMLARVELLYMELELRRG